MWKALLPSLLAMCWTRCCWAGGTNQLSWKPFGMFGISGGDPPGPVLGAFWVAHSSLWCEFLKWERWAGSVVCPFGSVPHELNSPCGGREFFNDKAVGWLFGRGRGQRWTRSLQIPQPVSTPPRLAGNSLEGIDQDDLWMKLSQLNTRWHIYLRVSSGSIRASYVADTHLCLWCEFRGLSMWPPDACFSEQGFLLLLK